jgi:phosphate transport system substrate-binding protein
MNVNGAVTGLSACFLICLLARGPGAEGQVAATLRPPGSNSPATIRIWGVGPGGRVASPLLGVLTKLEDDYRIGHPEVSFVHHLNGNDSALGGVYVGAADLALMDREPSYIELDGYQQAITGEKPFEIALMRGGIRLGGHSSPLVLIVNHRNPLRTLSTEQLEAIFSAAPQTAGRRVRTWGDLGLTGDWAGRPLQLYGFGIETSEARTFSKAVMADSRRWACVYREMGDTGAARAAERVEDAVARDPYSLGIATFDAVTAKTKIVTIEKSTGVATVPTPETLASGQYVLGRTVVALARAQKDGLVDVRIRSFLLYLVSSRAREIIAADGAYVPLAEELLAPERQGLR